MARGGNVVTVREGVFAGSALLEQDKPAVALAPCQPAVNGAVPEAAGVHFAARRRTEPDAPLIVIIELFLFRGRLRAHR